jgi:tRNA pseudouridine32 synthase/23S rRNA pseudouridine746 synthase
LFEYLCVRFPHIGEAVWRSRFARGQVLDQDHKPLALGQQISSHCHYFYYREVAEETALPFNEQVVYEDEHLLVIDKPHYLPVTPSGPYVQETVLWRQQKRLQEPDLSPLHRLDRETAGLLLLARQRGSRARYQALFREQKIHKTYHAIAPGSAFCAGLKFPLVHRSRMLKGAHFLQMQEVDGVANSETLIEVLQQNGAWAKYQLTPKTGRKHQLRVHMNSLGLSILHDRIYPRLEKKNAQDYLCPPLQLLAKSVHFVDPLSGREHFLTSRQELFLPA